MKKELGRFLMADGRIHMLSTDVLDNGSQVKVSIHEWPDGHRSECKIFSGPNDKVEEDLLVFVEESFKNGSYIMRLESSS